VLIVVSVLANSSVPSHLRIDTLVGGLNLFGVPLVGCSGDTPDTESVAVADDNLHSVAFFVLLE